MAGGNNAQNDVVKNYMQNDSLTNEFQSDPSTGVMAALSAMGHGSLADPFTQTLINTYGGNGVLQTLFDIYAPSDQANGPLALKDFAQGFLQSFYPAGQTTGNPSDSPAPTAPFGINVGDYGNIGNTIRGVLSPGSGLPGANGQMAQILAQGTPDQVRGAINNVIDVLAPFTMTNERKSIIELQLRQLEVAYINQGGFQKLGRTFGDFIKHEGSKWLMTWFGSGDPDKADAIVNQDIADTANGVVNSSGGIPGVDTAITQPWNPYDPNQIYQGGGSASSGSLR